MPYPRMTAERFFARATPEPNTGCWLWTGTGQKRGYGHSSIDGVRMPATHMALLFAGRPLKAGEMALHSCDNPPCVNPGHLRAGDHVENMKDKVSRGRQARGERITSARTDVRGEAHHNSTASDMLVEISRVVYADGVFTQKQLAKWFGVGQSTINRWVHNEVRA